MDTGKTTTLIISLVVGVVLIAGVMTPILANMLEEIGSSNATTITNSGGRIGEITSVMEEYDIHTEYELWEEAQPPYDVPSVGSKIISFVSDGGDLIWQVWELQELMGLDMPAHDVLHSDTITQDCILVAGDDIIAYNYEEKTIYFILGQNTTDGPAITQIEHGSVTLDQLGVFLIMNDPYNDDTGTNLLFVAGDYYLNRNGFVNTGYAYSPTGDHTSVYGDAGEIYYTSDFTYGYMNPDSDGSDEAYFGYMNYNGQTVILESVDENITVTDAVEDYTSTMGCKYMDLGDGQGVTMTIDSNQHDPKQVTGNLYIVPYSVTASGESGGIGDTLTNIISLIPLIMTVGLVMVAVASLGVIKLRR